MPRTWRLIALILLLAGALCAQMPRWSEERANTWYAGLPWLVGSNYIPADAINELEMWQADTFNPQRIDLELGWAQSLGMNTMRVFLHDLLWKQDPAGFTRRIGAFLAIAQKHRIRPVFVLFDSCWDPWPRLGPQRAPIPGVHNSGWVQSPGMEALADPAHQPRLEAYVKGVVGAFGRDQRILAWDVWNEPDNPNRTSYGKFESPDKAQLVLAMLPKAFEWAREAGATQPLTTGVWRGDWTSLETMTEMAQLQVTLSDVISFHSYEAPSAFEDRIRSLRKFNRPIICTEYMARGNGSTFELTLPIAKQYKTGAINWGFVAGKTQTWLPWDSWKSSYANREPSVWFHEVFRGNGKPYRQYEVDVIRELNKKTAAR